MVGAEQKKKFLDNPERYLPAMGGDCVVSLIDDDQLIAGSVYHSLVVEGKLYLFAGAEQKRAFNETPARYIETKPDPPAAEKDVPGEAETAGEQTD